MVVSEVLGQQTAQSVQLNKNFLRTVARRLPCLSLRYSFQVYLMPKMQPFFNQRHCLARLKTTDLNAFLLNSNVFTPYWAFCPLLSHV